MLLRIVHRPAHRITALSRLSSRKLMQAPPSRKEFKGKRSTFFVDNLPIGPKNNTNSAPLLTEQVFLPKIPQNDNFNSLSELNTTATESTTAIESTIVTIQSTSTIESATVIESVATTEPTAAIESTTAIESTIFQTSSAAPSPDKSAQPKQRKRKSRAVAATPDALAANGVEGQEVSSNIEQLTNLSPLERPTRSIVLDTVRSYVAKYPNCVLLTQVGDFYELYEDQAATYAPLLDLKLTSKEIVRDLVVNFTGFPLRATDRYLDILVNKLGRHVALCDQYTVAGGVKRRVSRIITPGTLIDEQFLNPYEYNFLLAVSTELTNDTLGLAWLDLSTGDFVMQKTCIEDFSDDLERIRPREIVLRADFESLIAHPLMVLLRRYPGIAVTYQPSENFTTQLGLPILSSMFPNFQLGESPESTPSKRAERSVVTPRLSSIESFEDVSPPSSFTFSPQELAAAAALLAYVDSTQMGRRPRLQEPARFDPEHVLKIDGNAMMSLELMKTMRDSKKADSFFTTIDRTETKAGSRLLSEWLSSPLTSVRRINARLDIVDFFCSDTHLLTDTRTLLRTSGDAQRAIQRLSLNRGQHTDLLDVRWTIEAMTAVKTRIEAAMTGKGPARCHMAVREIVARLEPRMAVAEFIANAIDEKRVGQKADKEKEYGFVKMSFSQELIDLYARLKTLEAEKMALQQRLQNDFGSSLNLVTSALYRHVVELNAKDAGKLSKYEGATLVQQTKGKKYRYQLQEWTNLSVQMETTQVAIVNEEAKVFDKTRDVILEESDAIIRDCRILAQLDVLSSFGFLALQQAYVRPLLNYSYKNKIIGGRHPVVERNLGVKGRHFVKNDCFVGEDQQIWLLTGPNMGGKSTFLRQNALISIMAQMGSYVPTDFAEIGIIDRLFSRVGAADNLAQDQSTFMVEMLETANILKNATPRSFVIMDEVGRGTSTLDGLSIAYATLHHLYHHTQCRTIFATHYYELADMTSVRAGQLPAFGRIGCYQTNMQEDNNGGFTFIHNVKPGVCRKSHGIHVAQLAGLPPSVLSLARQTLGMLEMLEERSGQTRIVEMKKILEEEMGSNGKDSARRVMQINSQPQMAVV